MKLHASRPAAALMIDAYDETQITVGGRRMTRSFMLHADGIDESWCPGTIDPIPPDAISALALVHADVLILGTGRKQRFPPADALAPLIAQQRGLEVMDTFAACRTYNLLASEGRSVAAALVIEGLK